MKRRSFTLIETMFVVALTAVITILLVTSLNELRSFFQMTDILINIQADARSAINKMSLDLRTASSKPSTSPPKINITQNQPSAGNDSITYCLPNYSGGVPVLLGDGSLSFDEAHPITIQLDPAGTKYLLKIQNGNTYIISHDVENIKFIDHGIDTSLYLDELKIIISLSRVANDGRTYRTNLTSLVNMRN